MARNNTLLFGPLGFAILAVAVIGLAFMVPGYSHVRQTVSEIGEVGSPARIAFAVSLCAVGLCLLIFAWGVWREAGVGIAARVGALLIAFMGIPCAGVGIFAFPHSLHNVFGELELIGYQAPLAFALAWAKDPVRRGVSRFSWICFVLVWVSIALNLSSMARGELWTHLQPFYGLVQRSLFAIWFGWCAVLGLMLWRQSGART